MFGLFTNVVEDTLDVADSVFSGEEIPKHQAAKMIDAGLTVYAISEATGVAVEVIERMIE